MNLQNIPKPKLAQLNENFQKVKDLNDTTIIESTLNFIQAILNIKTNSENEKKNLYQQMIIIWDILKSKFPNITTEEIKEAFKMYVAGEFENIKVFRNVIDAILVCEVLNAYIDFRNENLRVYEAKKKLLLNQPSPPSSEDKKQIREKFIKLLFEELTNNDFYPDAWLLYDELIQKGKIKITDTGKKFLYKQELEKYISEKKKQIESKGAIFSISANKEIKRLTTSDKPERIVQNRCKSILVCEVLKPKINDGIEEFKKFIYE